MNQDNNKVTIPKAQIIYGDIVYWLTVVACVLCMVGPVISVASPENNILSPYELFNKIFEGKSSDEIWNEVGGGFPGGHFYLSNLSKGDCFTHLGLAIGCSCALWALLASAVGYAIRKDITFTILSIWVAFLIFVSFSGIGGVGH